ncbi:Alpha/beta hydrolase [Modestobacter sp. DSM 44400]|uniref:alpha/beta hydrolase n=1 Tax=Modestobacter sp. DSM 44400 TaxID=1550230 RepID=UPI00089CE239|nr:alpha/beta hydrolase [Modestobacter sp. DSM 44400]SDX70329.1 Alpha/beta hydrolase [Modestobacter sp. DSM 44400]
MTGAPTLTEVAGWDVPLLRGAVGTLGLVIQRLVPWRVRLDAVGRQFGGAECWSGPAGTAAAAALVELSAVTSRVRTALDAASGLLAAAVTDAAEAQHLASAALSVAAAGGVPLDSTGKPLPEAGGPTAVLPPGDRADRRLTTARSGALADEALAAATRTLIAVHSAAEPVGRLRQAAGPGAVGFDDLTARLAPVGPIVPPPPPPPPPPPLPGDRGPGAVATWWAGLSAAQQRAVVATRPGKVGGLDGLPGWARDLANRRLLDRSLGELPPGGARDMATAVAAEVRHREGAGQPVRLLQFDPAGDLVSLSLGNVDTAAAVALLVPGIRTTPADDLRNVTDDAADVAAAATAAAPGLAVATVVWLGYRTPHLLGAPFRWAADRAAPALDGALDGLAAARSAPGAAPPPRTTVLAHSYGTLVTGRAARQPGRLAADAVVLLGSPGVEGWTARDLEAPEIYGAWSPADLVAVTAGFGSGPTDPWFGDVELPTDPTQGHAHYYDADRPTLAAIGEVVAGRRDPG